MSLIGKGFELTIQGVRKYFDEYALRTAWFKERFEEVRVLKGKPRRWRARVRVDPSGYLAARNEEFTTTVDEVISDATSELEQLTEEMRDWYDNMPEGLQQGSTGESVSEAADQLESISLEDAPDLAKTVKVLRLPDMSTRTGRGHRAGVVVSELRLAAETLREQIVEDEEATNSVTRADIDEYCGTLEEAADELEGVEFPTMYG